MHRGILVAVSMALLFVSAASWADDTAPFIPSEFIVSRDPPGITVPPRVAVPTPDSSAERPAGVTGELYTVIAPVYLGGGPDGGNTSYFRFYNASTVPITFTARVVGYRTDTTTDSQSNIIATAVFTVSPYASPQYSINDIFDAAGVSSIACPSTCPPNVYQGAALYISSSNPTYSGFQHVIYNSNSQFFENLTICGDRSLSDGKYFTSTSNVINAHTTTIAAYPTYLMFHNYASTNVQYQMQIYEARTGVEKGIYVATALANTTYLLPMSFIQSQIGWSPTSSEFHANILIATKGGGTYYGYSGLLIYNQGLQAYINMSEVCGIVH